ncbi:MAG: (Fe-S)-binding protein [Euryarchaeota archaeon]|nr:(Fe-S)-binding protein [Euryarchaeota archaeon]
MAAAGKLPVRKGLEGAEGAILTCTQCGYCKESCPFFNELGWDTNTARGRVLLSYALLHGLVPADEKTVEAIYGCTLCRKCENDCSSKLRILDILEAVRRDLAASGKLLPPHAEVLRRMEEGGNIFADRTPTTEMHGERERPAPVAYFAGCVSSFSARRPAQATRRLLGRMGVDFTMFDELCCGYPAHLLGAGFEKVARGNIERLRRLGVKTLVLSCDGCFRMFKEVYPESLKDGLEVRHLAEVIDQNIDRLPEPKVKETVTLHDSCDLGRHMGMYDLPRRVLSRFANIEEMPAAKERALCCGSGGGARIAFGGTSDAIALRRLDMAERVSPLLVTTCPACAHSMEVVARKGKKRVRVCTLAQYIEETIRRNEAG